MFGRTKTLSKRILLLLYCCTCTSLEKFKDYERVSMGLWDFFQSNSTHMNPVKLIDFTIFFKIKKEKKFINY